MGWANYWARKEHTPKPLCSQLYCLDSFLTFQSGLQRLLIPKIGVCAWLKDGNFTGHCNGMPFSLKVVAQSCNYGGYRYFFLCSGCSARMRKVYFANGAFCCRKCLNLGYYSQRLRASNGFIRMKWKIIESLVVKHGCEYRRPPRMWRRTYTRLQKCIENLELKAWSAFVRDHPMFTGLSGPPY